MGHRKWSQEKGCGLFSSEVNEHNALYDAYKNSEKWRMETLDENNRLDRELDEARKRIAELESMLRVPFSDDVIERMVKAAQETMWRCGTTWPDCIRAALAAGGLEPCADPADVYGAPTGHVLRDRLVEAERKVENQRMNLRQIHEARERDALKLAAVEAERDGLRTQLTRESEWTKQYKQDRDDALAELEAVKVERDSFSAECTWLKEQITNGKSQLAALRDRDSVPVKVRWDVSDDHIKMAVELGTFIRLDLDKVAHLREVFAAHAVIDVPAGVPSVPVYGGWHFEDGYKIVTNGQPSSNAGQFDADEVEALARVLYNVKHHGWTWDKAKAHCVEQARAAIAHMRKRPEGLPTADLLKTIAIAFYQYSGVAEMVLDKHDEARFGRILAALTPYLGDPVGKPELDVTAVEAMDLYYEKGHVLPSMQAVLDLCRSRIRPVYECKECANWKAHAAAIEDSSFDMIKRINLARAALEGE